MIDLLHMASDLASALPLDVAPLIPDPEPSLPDGVATPVATVFSWLKGIGLVVCVVGVIAAAIMIGIGHRRGEGPREALGQLMAPIGAAIIIGGAAGLITTVAGY